jgi:hypothetical protein
MIRCICIQTHTRSTTFESIKNCYLRTTGSKSERDWEHHSRKSCCKGPISPSCCSKRTPHIIAASQKIQVKINLKNRYFPASRSSTAVVVGSLIEYASHHSVESVLLVIVIVVACKQLELLKVDFLSIPARELRKQKQTSSRGLLHAFKKRNE